MVICVAAADMVEVDSVVVGIGNLHRIGWMHKLEMIEVDHRVAESDQWHNTVVGEKNHHHQTYQIHS